MAKRNTYCEVNFLKKFSDKYISQGSPFDDEQLLKNTCWIGLFNFLRKKAVLVIDDKACFNNLSLENPFCRNIKKLWANGSLQIKEERVDLSNLQEDALRSSVFFYDDQPFILQKAEKLGILVITPSTYAQFACLYKDNGFSVHTNDIVDWSILKQKGKHNFNALVISDLYVLKERNINLYAILDALLPKDLETEMHISIFTQETPNFDQDFNDIVAHIQSIRPKLKFNFSLHKGMSTDFHDRGIVTNYMRMKCGAGFDLLKISRNTGDQVARITTDVDIDFPYFKGSEVSEGSYENILQDAKKMYMNNICKGTKNNRLLA